MAAHIASAGWATIALAALLAAGNAACVGATPVVMRWRRSALRDHQLHAMLRILLTGVGVGAFYGARAALLWPALLRNHTGGVVEALAWAAFLPSYGALVWQLAWRTVTNEHIAAYTTAAHSTLIASRPPRLMRASYYLSLTHTAELAALLAGTAQASACIVAGERAPGSTWAYAAVALAWLCGGVASAAALYTKARTSALAVSRRLLVRVLAVWVLVCLCVLVMWTDGVSPEMQETALVGGTVASTALGVWDVYVRAAYAHVRAPRGPARARRRGRWLPVAVEDSNRWARAPEDPHMVTVRSWVRMVYADDRAFGAWMAYVHARASSYVAAASALRTIALCEAGAITDVQCLTNLRLTRAARDVLMEPLWVEMAERLASTGQVLEDGSGSRNVFSGDAGTTLVRHVVADLADTMRDFVESSDELRGAAVDEMQARLAANLGGDAAPGAYPAAVGRDEEEMHEVLLYEVQPPQQ